MTNYYVKFKKVRIGSNGKEYQDNSGFCFKELKSECIKRQFNRGFIRIDEMIVRPRFSKQIIYKGNNYQEYLKAVDEWFERNEL